MSILRYIPKNGAVNDRRSPEGGYYEAICYCGQKFYPKRSDAMYCSKNCALKAYRKEKKEDERQQKIALALQFAEKYRKK